MNSGRQVEALQPAGRKAKVKIPPPHRPLVGRNLGHFAEIVEKCIRVRVTPPDLQIIIDPRTISQARLSVFTTNNHPSFASDVAFFSTKTAQQNEECARYRWNPRVQAGRKRPLLHVAQTNAKRSLGCTERS